MINLNLLSVFKKQRQIIKLKSTGNSMFPEIIDGDILHVHCCEFEWIRTGDLIVFLNDENIVCHRCIKVFDDYFIEKGDNCTLFSKLNKIDSDKVIGIVSSVTRNNKLVNININSKYKKLMLLIANTSNLLSFNIRKYDCSNRGLVENIISKLILYTWRKYGNEKERD